MLNDHSGINEQRKAILLKHKEAFVDQFKNENIEGLGDNISLSSFFWFANHIRPSTIFDDQYSQYLHSGKIGFLTFRVIGILFKRPGRIFNMNKEEIDEYFASNKYRQDIDCNFFLDFNKLTDSLCSLMIDELGYHRQIVLLAKEELEKKPGKSRNQTEADMKAQVVKKLDEEGIMPEILEYERIYEKYLYPLVTDAGATN